MAEFVAEEDLRAVRQRGPSTICVLCARPFSHHRMGDNTFAGPIPGSVAWCFVPALYVGDELVHFLAKGVLDA